MAALIDVLLRGLALAASSVTLGGFVFAWWVLGVRPGVKPDAASARALRLVAGGAALTAAGQLAIMLTALVALAAEGSGWRVGAYLGTAFAQASLARAALAAAVSVVAAVLARGPRGRLAWAALGAGSFLLVGSSAWFSHAIARVGDRGLLLALDAAHQVAVALWVGGLVHLLVYTARRPPGPATPDAAVGRRFSALAFRSMMVLAGTGVALTVLYVGDLGGLVGTAYGIMVLTKVVLLLGILGVASVNLRLVRRVANPTGEVRLARYVEVETGLAITVLLAAASLTSQPPAVDVHADRATVREVAARFIPRPPRLSSPSLAAVLPEGRSSTTNPLPRRLVDREWSEFNHNWAGLFVLAVGILGALAQGGARWARHWPLLFVGLAGLLFFRNDPEVWPLGPIGFWESLRLPEVLQHRVFVLLIVMFGLFEWAVRTRRLRARPWAYVFPVLCAVGGALLLTHSHTVFNVKEEFLMEVSHAPIGVLGAFAGWARWLELRFPESGPAPGRIWPACLILVGILLAFYRET